MTANLTLGFEFESQATDGYTSQEPDFDPTELTDDPTWVADVLGCLGNQEVARLIARDLLAARLEEYASEELRENSTYTEPDHFYVPGLEVDTDGSVAGFEFRTKGGTSLAAALETVRELFSRYSHDVDKRCGFHVHVGGFVGSPEELIPHVQAYIVGEAERLPGAVRARWESGAIEFFEPSQRGAQKFSFVRNHPQGTLECRGFGNVSNAEEARICLELAVEAVAYAEAVIAGRLPMRYRPGNNASVRDVICGTANPCSLLTPAAAEAAQAKEGAA